jgi:hypothetical protein
MTISTDTSVSDLTPQQPAVIGSLIYLASYLLRLTLSAEVTPPDTPNMYSAKAEIMADQGDMNLDPLVGPQGFPGRAQFQLRRQTLPVVSNPDELPDNLTNTDTDIGKYWQIAEISEGVIVGLLCYVWYGTSWRVFQIGTTGAPGPVPDITPNVELIPPQPAPTYPDTTSYISTSGTTMEPSWVYGLAVPAGPTGPITPLYTFPDVDEQSITPVAGDILACSGEYTDSGLAIWKPLSRTQFATQFYSMPESAFSHYSGVSQRAPIGSFAFPPQPFPWTPIVWGHIGAGGANLSLTPLKIGCEVLLGDPSTGTLISRGLGNGLSEVNIMPHYSGSSNVNQAITPINGYAVVPANHTSPAQGTVYVNLWNDGQLGVYDFNPGGAQLFGLAVPMEQAAGFKFAPFEAVR